LINFSAISWWEQVNFQWDDDEVRFVLKNNTLSWIFIILAHWNKSLWVDMSLHSDTLFWFRVDQSLLFLLNAACLVEKMYCKTRHNNNSRISYEFLSWSCPLLSVYIKQVHVGELTWSWQMYMWYYQQEDVDWGWR
jgi:hypothetical protein